jgi:hypothetical protein
MNIENKKFTAKLHLRSTPNGDVVIDGIIPQVIASALFAGQNQNIECIVALKCLVLEQAGTIEENHELGGAEIKIHPKI